MKPTSRYPDDAHRVEEILLALVTESTMYDERQAIIARMIDLIGANQYNSDTAWYLWRDWIEKGCRKFVTHMTCSSRVIRLAAGQMAENEKETIDSGEYSHYPRKGVSRG